MCSCRSSSASSARAAPSGSGTTAWARPSTIVRATVASGCPSVLRAVPHRSATEHRSVYSRLIAAMSAEAALDALLDGDAADADVRQRGKAAASSPVVARSSVVTARRTAPISSLVTPRSNVMRSTPLCLQAADQRAERVSPWHRHVVDDDFVADDADDDRRAAGCAAAGRRRTAPRCCAR